MVAASNNTDAPSITIFGATGIQGGSVLRHLLNSDKPYRIRAVTRDSTKPAAQKLTEQGAEVVQADLENQDEVEKAVKGQDLVFAVTNFWEHGREKEVADGRRLMDIVKSAGIKKIFWSGLEPVSKVTNGKYTKVEHFDSKAEILEYAKSIGVPVVDVQPACYMENWLTMLAPRKQEDGSFVFALPVPATAKFSLINCAGDYGAYVRGAIESDAPVGSEILACAEEIDMQTVVDTWAQVTGNKASFYPIDAEQFKGLAGEEVTQMMQYFGDFGYYGGKDISPSQKVLAQGSNVHTWKTFVEAQDWSKITA